MPQATPQRDLAELQEISIPEPVSYRPQTVGWVLLAALALGLAAAALAVWRKSRSRNRYRREALRELERLRGNPDPVQRLRLLPGLIKQTALAAAGREKAAALSGEEWLRFLDETAGGDDFRSGPGRLLPQLSYASPATLKRLPAVEAEGVLNAAERWIKRHRA